MPSGVPRHWRTNLDRFGDTQGAQLALQILLIIIAGYGLAEILAVVVGVIGGGGSVGFDYLIYMERTRSWLAGNGFYLPHQLAGPYPIADGDGLYPPVALWLFVPFTVLPGVLWWAVPTVIIGVSVWSLRPSCSDGSCWASQRSRREPASHGALGNPSMWAYAALAAGLAFGWATPMVALKPTLGLFALIGIHRRRWWVGAAVLLGLSLPFGTMWFDYATVLLNAKQTAQHGLGYLIGEWPAAAALAFVAWQCRQPRAEPAHDLAHGVAPLAHGRRSPDLDAPFEE